MNKLERIAILQQHAQQPLHQAAAALGISVPHACRLYRKYGIKRRLVLNKNTVKAAVGLRYTTITELAQLFGVCRQTLCKFIHTHQISWPRNYTQWLLARGQKKCGHCQDVLPITSFYGPKERYCQRCVSIRHDFRYRFQVVNNKQLTCR